MWIEGTPWSHEIHQTRLLEPRSLGATYGGAQSQGTASNGVGDETWTIVDREGESWSDGCRGVVQGQE